MKVLIAVWALILFWTPQVWSQGCSPVRQSVNLDSPLTLTKCSGFPISQNATIQIGKQLLDVCYSTFFDGGTTQANYNRCLTLCEEKGGFLGVLPTPDLAARVAVELDIVKALLKTPSSRNDFASFRQAAVQSTWIALSRSLASTTSKAEGWAWEYPRGTYTPATK